MKDRLHKIAPLFPWLGLLLIVAGLLIWFVTRRFQLANNALLVSGALLLLLFVWLRPYDVRTLLGLRTMRYGASALLSTSFLVAILVLVYWIVFQNPGWRLDVTQAGEFTPLPETVALLKQLDEPVHVIGFYSPRFAAQQARAEPILANLAAASDRFSYEFKDPELNPLEAQQYDLNFDGTLVFIKGEGENQLTTKSSVATEQEIHTALVKLVDPVKKKLYLLTGHGEFGREDSGDTGLATAVAFLEDQGFEVADLNLFTAGSVPDDATVIALINQEAPMNDAEVEAIRQFLQGGGSAFIAREVIDSQGKLRAEQDGLNAMLRDDWGITLRNDVIIDPALAQAGVPIGFTFLGSSYGNSPIITDDLRRLGVVFDLARSLDWQETAGVNRLNLVMTSDQAWGETDIQTLSTSGAVAPDPEDAQGALPVGLSAENGSSGGRLVVFGDTSFITNQGVGYGGNGVLLANALNWLADDEISIALAPREQITRQVVVPERQLRLLRLTSVWLAPLLMVVAAAIVAASRRQAG